MRTLDDLASVVSRVFMDFKPDDAEAAVMSKIVYPVITEGLGISPDDIDFESPLTSTSAGGGTGRADLVVTMDGNPVLVVEAKAPHRNIFADDILRETLTQAERYAIRLPADFVLISNGHQWLLTKGRRKEFEAASLDDFWHKLPLFHAWLNAENLWCSATGLIVPATFEDPGVLQRCRDLTVDESDLKWLDNIREQYPTFVPRIQEEVRKSLAGREVRRSADATESRITIAHIDTSFTDYRPGAWQYDQLYERHVQREAEFLRYWRKTGALRAALRFFVVDDGVLRERPSDVYTTVRRMLRDGWTVVLITPMDMARLELSGTDVVGDNLTTTYPAGEAFDYRFRRDARAAQRITETLAEYVASNPQMVFEDTDSDIRKLAELAMTWWRNRKRVTGDATGA